MLVGDIDDILVVTINAIFTMLMEFAVHKRLQLLDLPADVIVVISVDVIVVNDVVNMVELCVDWAVDVSLVVSVVDEIIPMNVLLNMSSIPSQHNDIVIINILYIEEKDSINNVILLGVCRYPVSQKKYVYLPVVGMLPMTTGV